MWRIKINIFYLSNDPEECARWHNNRHCVKQIVEAVQLLSTAHKVLDGKQVIKQSKTGRSIKTWELTDERNNILYKSTHTNHPVSIWVRESDSNYKWLHQLLKELCKEYTHRYGKIHKCEIYGLVELLKTPPKNIPKKDFTPVTPAMPLDCIIPNDSIASYQLYYKKHKKHLANWTGKVNSRPIPDWYY